MIEAKELKKVYKTKKGVIVNALDGVSLKLPDTGMVFILGKSGSGKSTLLNVLGGLDNFDGGEIIVKGTSTRDFGQSHFDSYRNTYIGFIFQEYNVLEELTVGANIALAIELQGRKATNDEINYILTEVDLEGYGNRKPNELSGGQKQRVAIARALVKNPEIIMADEPTGALDSATGKQVFDTLKHLSQDKLVLIVSHDREFSEQYADRIIELKDGKIISDVEKKSGVCADETLPEEDGLTFTEEEISVKAGYQLTEEDRLLINEYLLSLDEGKSLNIVRSKAKKKVNSDDFAPTDESKIEMKKSDSFKLIKSKLSMKNAFKLGSGGLKYKKFRLVFTIFLSLIAFTLFGLADTIAAYNNIETATSSIRDSGVNYSSYVKNIKRYYSDGDFYWNEYDTYLSASDIEKIELNAGHEVIGVYNKELSLEYTDVLGKLNADSGKNLSMLYNGRLSGIAAYDKDILDSLGFELLGEKSRVPSENAKEIVIPKFIFDHFSEAGFRTQTDEGFVDVEINTYDDIIGKELNLNLHGWSSGIYNPEKYKIVGVIDTKFDDERYRPMTETNNGGLSDLEYMALSMELEAARTYSFACVGFVNSSLMDGILYSTENNSVRLNDSNLRIFWVVDDSFDNVEDLYKDNENLKNESYISRITTLDKIKNEVSWIGEPLSSLRDNQLILSESTLIYMIRGDWESTNILYDNNALMGFEKTLFDNIQAGVWMSDIGMWTLSDVLFQMEYVSAFKYAYENKEEAKAAVEEVYYEIYGSEINVEDYVRENTLYNDYARFCTQRMINFPEQRIEEYFDSIVKRYDLADSVLPDDIIEELNVTCEYKGVEYASFDNMNRFTNMFADNYRYILARNYAFENFEDAKAYYIFSRQPKDEEFEYISFTEIVDNYTQYVSYGDNVTVDGEEFIPSSKVDFTEYLAENIVKVYRAVSDRNKVKTVLSYENYMNGDSGLLKNAEIVGVSHTLSGDVACISDTLSAKLLGANTGGVYSFAVGTMPKNTEDIRKVVTFAKTFEEGDVRYQLKNNVMEELDMVDELLDILGQVFLYVGLGFALFASLMLSNFIATSISHKKQEIGILRAIGSRSLDVFKIFFAESFIIAMINYVLSVAGTFTVTYFINKILREDAGLLITFLNFGLRQIAVLFGVSILVALIATFLPVKKIASMKPIDAIKNRK